MRKYTYRGYTIRLTSKNELWFIDIRINDEPCFLKETEKPHQNDASAYDWALYTIDQALLRTF
jgi:hypothetical protein